MRLQIRTRLALVFAGMTLVVLGVAAVALLLGFKRELDRTINQGLRSRAASIEAHPLAALDAIREGDDVFAQVVRPDGTVLSSANLRTRPLLTLDLLGSLHEKTILDGEIRTLEERVATRLLVVPSDDGSFLVVGVDVEDQREAVARLTTFVAIGGPLLLLAISGLGWIIAGAALRPVERLRSEAAAISSAEPARRLPVPETGDELQRLAETLNVMLDRLHEALERERRFVDEASHELRTPLGVLTAELELALKQPRSRGELEGALRSVSQEAQRLRRLTQDLLVLARSDRGRVPVHREDADVSGIVGAVVDVFAERAAANEVSLRWSAEDARARVDADRIRQALENLVDNALRHTGPGGEVEIIARRTDGRLRLSVLDTGSGFDAGVLERAFEPFARAHGDREAEGAGLGLAIVRAVAEAHGGTASIENRPGGGSAVTIELPLEERSSVAHVPLISPTAD